MTTIAGKPVDITEVRATIGMLRYYQKFLASEFEKCVSPERRDHGIDTLTKSEARRRLTFLINTAINRKAGIPDHAEDIELWRDCQLVQHLIHRNNPNGLQWRWTNMHRFRTNRIQKRYGYLLANGDDL